MRTASPEVADRLSPENHGDNGGELQRRETPGLSRRDLLGLWRGHRGPSVAIAAASGSAGLVGARARASEVSADVDPGALVTKLVRRLTMGLTPAELTLAYQLGYDGYLEYHLNHTAIDDSALQPRLAPLATLGLTYSQLVNYPASQVINELIEAAIVRAVYSRRQFYERMVEFWTDHFNIDINNNNNRYSKTVDDREVIRPNALGSFPALLSASAHSPAMLYYLDNQVSIAGNPNENYARELLELHTLGVDGGYTQDDVEAVARCFTGWGINNVQGAFLGTFLYSNNRHDQGQKTVLGNIIPENGGMQDGLTVLSILADHPNTARFVSKKLCRWLLGENTPTSIVTDVAATYTATAGDIKAMIRTALRPNNLSDAAPRYKRPFHHFVSVLRTCNANITSTTRVRNDLSNAGHRPFTWPTPDGYPDSTSHWIGLITPRWNFAANAPDARLTGVSVDVPAFFSGATTAAQMAERLNQSVFAGEMDPFDKQRITDFLLPDPPSSQRQREAIGLAMSSPDFQWY